MLQIHFYNKNSNLVSIDKNMHFPFREVLDNTPTNQTTPLSNIVVVGIGGSDLGTRAIFNALVHPYNNELNSKKIYFAGDTTDPDQILSLFDVLNLSDTLFLLVSKSGETIEITSYLEILQEKLKQNNLKLSDHIWIVTDPVKGSFREYANVHQIKTFGIPKNIGGRFSVLTDVGLVPASLFNLNTIEMLKGAKEMDTYFFRTVNDLVSQYVQFKLDEYSSGKNISVLMPYKYGLKDFAKWYQQLWSESLGKNGKGQTPISMLGPVDQHSQLQLMLDGPDDKFVTIIKVRKSKTDVADMNELLNIEADATIQTLAKKGKPLCVIEIPELNEYYLGQLFYFFQIAVTLFANSIGVNAFDQPAVEDVKQLINSKLRL